MKFESYYSVNLNTIYEVQRHKQGFVLGIEGRKSRLKINVVEMEMNNFSFSLKDLTTHGFKCYQFKCAPITFLSEMKLLSFQRAKGNMLIFATITTAKHFFQWSHTLKNILSIMDTAPLSSRKQLQRIIVVIMIVNLSQICYSVFGRL